MVAMPNNLAQTYFDSADVIMIAVNSDEMVIDVNKKGCAILGYRKPEILGKNWFDKFVPENSRKGARISFHEMLKGAPRHVHSEYPIVKKNREKVIINWHNVISLDKTGSPIGILGSGLDVTDQRKAEKATTEIENRLQTTLDSMIEGCQIIDRDWRYAYINESAAKQGRQTKKELLGHTMTEMYPGIQTTELFKILKDCMNRRVPNKMETEFTFPDGTKGWFELRIEPVPEGILILSTEITKRKELEEELNRYRLRLEQVVAERTAECAEVNAELTRELQEHQKVEEGLLLRATILDNAKEAIFLVNSKGGFVYANKAACTTYGYTRDEFLNLNLRQLLRPEEQHEAQLHLKEVLEKGQLETETIHVRKNGSPMSVQVRHSLVKTAHGRFIVSVTRETTKYPKKKQARRTGARPKKSNPTHPTKRTT